jgi:predicted dehydrogenase
MSPARAALLVALAVAALAVPAPAQDAAGAPAPAPPARRLRLAVAGLTHGHVHGILGRPDRGDVEIVGIVEKNHDLARRYAEHYGLAASLFFDDLAKMLDEVKPEAVAAFGPTSDHLSVVEVSAPRKIHVMVEKPLALTLAEARRISELAAANGVQVITNYETTWYGSHRRMSELVVQKGVIGGIRKMVIHDGHPGPVAIGVEKEFLEWLTDPARNGGGALMDFGCYGADLMTWLMQGQRPTAVTAIAQQLQPELYPKVDDEATILLAYPTAQGIIQASWNWPFGRKDTYVYGQKGYVFALDSRRVSVRRGDAEKVTEADPPPAPESEPFSYLAAVVRGDVRPGPNDLGSLPVNVIVMEILDAARESARTGKTVRLEAR